MLVMSMEMIVGMARRGMTRLTGALSIISVRSWADIARACFDAANGNGDAVVPVSTAEYYAGASGPVAPRPVHSALDLSKLEAAGFSMPDWEVELKEYLASLLGQR